METRFHLSNVLREMSRDVLEYYALIAEKVGGSEWG